MYYKLGEIPPLEIILIYITRYCNMVCKHCFVPTIKKDSLLSNNEIDFDSLAKVISESKDLGLNYVKITGGEPFIRKRLVLDLTRLCAKYDILVSYDTNATLLDEKDIREISSIGNVRRVAVSLDYATRYKFEEFRGLPNSYKKVLNTIEKFIKYNIDVLIMTSVYKDNINEIPKIAKIAKNLGAKVLFQPILPLGRAKTLLKDKLLIDIKTPAEIEFIERFLRKALEAFNDYPKGVYVHMPLALILRHGVKYILMAHTKCPYRNMLAILWDGSIAPCAIGISRPETIIGNIKKDNIRNLWLKPKGYLLMRYIEPKDFKGVCSKCVFQHYCAGFCIAYSYEIYRDFKMSNPICQLYYKYKMFPNEFLKS